MIRTLSLCLFAAASGSAFAVDGLPDSTFGFFSSGRNVITLNNGGTDSDSTVDVLVNADRSIFMVGTSAGAGGTSRYAITKLTANGAINTSFGSNGTVYSTMTNVQASRARLDANGNVVIVGTLTGSGTDKDFHICRFNPQGQPAPFSAIGTNCKRIAIDLGQNLTDEANDFNIDKQGRITILGTAGLHSARSFVAMRRLLPDGQLDPTFGTEGDQFRGLFEFVNTAINRGYALATASNGEYYIAGEAGDINSANGTGVLFARIGVNGFRDWSFQNGASYAWFDINQGAAFHRDDKARAIQILSNGNIVIAGNYEVGSGANQRNAFAFKFKPGDAATFDPNFGAQGQLYYANGYSSDFNRMLIQSDDQMVFVGTRQTTASSDSLMHIIRMSPDGGLDAQKFGVNGRVDVDFILAGGDDYGRAVASQDGSLLIAGHSKNQSAQDIDQTITRLHNDLIFADDLE